MGRRVREEGASESRPVMGRIGALQHDGKVSAREHAAAAAVAAIARRAGGGAAGADGDRRGAAYCGGPGMIVSVGPERPIAGAETANAPS